MTWHAVIAEPSAEFTAQDRLRRSSIRTWLPHRLERRRHKIPRTDRFRETWVRAALFQGYLFARLGREQYASTILDTDGVAGIVSAALVPLSVPCDVMDELRSMGDHNGLVASDDDQAPVKWSPGRVVMFRSGTALAGWAGVVEVDNSNSVRVFIEALKRAVTTTADKIEPV